MKTKVQEKHPTAIARPPSPRSMYYDEWTVVVPPQARGFFGRMARILGHGTTAKKAWADAATKECK